MRRSLWLSALVLCVGCGGNVDLGGGGGNGGTSGYDAGVAGSTGWDAGTAGTAGADAGGGCPATVLAQSTFPTRYSSLALDATNVYWLSSDSTSHSVSIEEEPKTGGNPRQLATVSDGQSLSSSGADLFIADSGSGVNPNSVSRVEKSTGQVTTLVSNLAALNVTANTTTAFFISELNGGTGYELNRVPRDGGSLSTLSLSPLDTPQPAGPVLGMGRAYWIKPGSPASIEAVSLLFTLPNTPYLEIVNGDLVGGPQTLAIDGGTLFYLEYNGSSALDGRVDVKAVSTTGGPSVTLVHNTNALRVIADGGEVYWRSGATDLPRDPGNKQGGSIQKVSATGGVPVTVTLASGLLGGTHVLAFAVDATHLYWIDWFQEGTGTSAPIAYRIMRICR